MARKVRKETRIMKIARLASKNFPLLLTSGVDVEEVVRFVFRKQSALDSKERKELGDDDRDYMNASDYLDPLSNKALLEIEGLKCRDSRRRLKEKRYPFSRLNKETREILYRLPHSWVQGGARWRLDARKPPISRADIRRAVERVSAERENS